MASFGDKQSVTKELFGVWKCTEKFPEVIDLKLGNKLYFL